jgi:lipid-binding SYLF domain-containing protein
MIVSNTKENPTETKVEVKLFLLVGGAQVVAKVDENIPNTWIDPCELQMVQTSHGMQHGVMPYAHLTEVTRVEYNPGTIIFISASGDKLKAIYEQSLQKAKKAGIPTESSNIITDINLNVVNKFSRQTKLN